MSDPVGGFSAGAPRRVMDRGGQEFNVKAFGGVSGTDHTTLLAAHLPEVIGARGTLLLPPGYDMQVGNLVVSDRFWGIKGPGATITHIGDNSHLLEVRATGATPTDTTGLTGPEAARFTLERVTLKAKQSATNPTQALLYLAKASHVVLHGVNFQAGNTEDYTQGVPANRYAHYCLYLYGRQNKSVYYCNFYSCEFIGAAVDNVYIDGWDAAYTPSATNVVNQNHWFGCTNLHAGQYGWNLQSGGMNYVSGGTCESNVSHGIRWGPYTRNWVFVGHRVEANNGGNSNAQMTWDQVGQPAGYDGTAIFMGNVGHALTDTEAGHFLVYLSGGAQKMYLANSSFGANATEINAPTGNDVTLGARKGSGLAVWTGDDLANATTIPGTVTGSGSAQTVTVGTAGTLAVGMSVTVSGGGGTPETVVLTAVNAGTPSITGIFVQSRTAGAAVAGIATERFRAYNGGIRVNAGSPISRISAQSASITWASLAAQATAEQDITLAKQGGGLGAGDLCLAGFPADPGAGLVWCARVKSSTTSTIRVGNVTVGAITPAAGTHKTLAIRS